MHLNATSPDGRGLVLYFTAQEKLPLPGELVNEVRLRGFSILPLGVVGPIRTHGGGDSGAAEHALYHSAVLIGQADDDGFAAGRHMPEGQRPHVALDDVLLLLRDMEVVLRIHAGRTGVRKAVHLKQAADAMEACLLYTS